MYIHTYMHTYTSHHISTCTDIYINTYLYTYTHIFFNSNR